MFPKGFAVVIVGNHIIYGYAVFGIRGGLHIVGHFGNGIAQDHLPTVGV